MVSNPSDFGRLEMKSSELSFCICDGNGRGCNELAGIRIDSLLVEKSNSFEHTCKYHASFLARKKNLKRVFWFIFCDGTSASTLASSDSFSRLPLFLD